VDVPGFGEPRKFACVVFYLCLLSVQYAQQAGVAAAAGAAAAVVAAGAAGAGGAAAAVAAGAAGLVWNLTCFSLKIFVSFCSWFWFGVI
jgi:hypothetical protein